MKNILVRAGATPFESLDAPTTILKNSIGNNVGNYLYLWGSLRNIVHEDTQVTASRYRTGYTEEELAEINETYDCFLVPLANAFRKGFVGELRGLTRMAKALDIPCVVSGVGITADLDDDCKHSFPFDDDVKEFMKAFLEKSATVGLRGERTADYLRYLGFKEGEHFTVTGCPSLYLAGPRIQIRETEISAASSVCYNVMWAAPDHVHEFIERSRQQFASAQFMPQDINEMKLLYLGQTAFAGTEDINPLFGRRICDSHYANGSTQFYYNVPTWLSRLRQADFAFGTRLHGNIAAILAGTPSIVFPKDSRVRELADFHGMVEFPVEKIDSDTSIWRLIEGVDFNQINVKQLDNYNHFIDFLEKNGLEPTRQTLENCTEPLPFDARVAAVDFHAPVTSIAQCSLEEMAERFESYYPAYNQEFFEYKYIAKHPDTEMRKALKKNEKLRAKVKNLKAKNAALKKKLRAAQSSAPQASKKPFWQR